MTPRRDTPRLLVAGLGNRTHGDDGIGVRLVESVIPRLPTAVEGAVWENADAFTLAQELIEHDVPVLFVDGAHMGEAPGTVHWWPAGRANLVNAQEEKSTHGFGLAYAIDLARGLGFERPLYFFAVEPADCAPGDALSPLLDARFAALESQLLATVDALLVDLVRDHS